MKKLRGHLRNGGIKEFGKCSLASWNLSNTSHERLNHLYVIVRQRISFPIISLSLKHRTYFPDWNILAFRLAHVTDAKVSAIYVKLSRKQQRAGFGLGRQQTISTGTPAASPARNRHEAELFPQPSKEIGVERTLDFCQLPNYEAAVTELCCHLPHLTW